MPHLPPRPTLADMQRYVAELETERGFQGQDVVQKALLLGEEVGELFKALRKSQGLSIDPQSRVGSVSEELAGELGKEGASVIHEGRDVSTPSCAL